MSGNLLDRQPRLGRPDFISVSDQPRGRDVVIHDKGTHHLDLLLVVEVEKPDTEEATPKSAGNGE